MIPRFRGLTTGGPNCLPHGTPRQRTIEHPAAPVAHYWSEQHTIRLCACCAVILGETSPLSEPLFGYACYICGSGRTPVRVYLDPSGAH